VGVEEPDHHEGDFRYIGSNNRPAALDMLAPPFKIMGLACQASAPVLVVYLHTPVPQELQPDGSIPLPAHIPKVYVVTWLQE